MVNCSITEIGSHGIRKAEYVLTARHSPEEPDKLVVLPLCGECAGESIVILDPEAFISLVKVPEE